MMPKFSKLRAAFVAGVAIAALGVLAAPPVNAQGKPLKIGFSMALTGPLAGAGKAALIAMQIWKDDINKQGGLLGRKVEFVFYDDATSPSKVPGIYSKLLNVDKVDLVVSSYGTNEISPAMPIVMRKGLVFMSLFGLAVNDKFAYDRYFQIMPAGPVPKDDWSRGFFNLAMEQNPKPKTVALLAEDADFALNAVAGARRHAERLGIKIVYDKTFPFGLGHAGDQGGECGFGLCRILSGRLGRSRQSSQGTRPQSQDVRRRHGRSAVCRNSEEFGPDAQRHRQL